MNQRRVMNSVSMLPMARLAKELVSVEEWDCDVWVWELTVKDLDAYRGRMLETRGAKVIGLNMAGNTARLLSYAIRDEQGTRVFADHDVERLMEQGSGPIEKLAAVARRLSHLDEDDDESDLVGNSEPARTEGSSLI